MVREYVFEIGGKPHNLQVPAEFDMDQLLAEKFAGIDSLRDLPMVVGQDDSIARGRMKLSDKKSITREIFHWRSMYYLVMPCLLTG